MKDNKQELTPVREYTNANSKELYVPSWTTIRPGSDEHEKVPSRVNQRREYRDGKVEVL
jgi:hypothetical protein